MCVYVSYFPIGKLGRKKKFSSEKFVRILRATSVIGSGIHTRIHSGNKKNKYILVAHDDDDEITCVSTIHRYRIRTNSLLPIQKRTEIINVLYRKSIYICHDVMMVGSID